MPLTRQQKKDKVAAATKDLQAAASCVVVAYNGLNVDDMEQLRGKLHQSDARVRVLPKRLLRLVFQNINLNFDPVQIEGQVAVAWGNDVIAPAKIMHEFAQTRTHLVRLVGGAMEGRLLEQAQVIALAQLPSKDQLRGQLLSVLIGPLRGLAATLDGVQRNFVCALQAVTDKKAALVQLNS